MIKKTALVAMLMGSVMGGSSLALADPLKSFMECSNISEDIVRLACFDAATKKAKQMPAENPKDNLSPQDETIDNFGKSQLKSSPLKSVQKEQQKEQKEDVDRIRLMAVKYKYSPLKRFVIYMKNGQIWQQKDGGRIPLPKGEFEVEIAKGALSGYYMVVPTRKSMIRVKRLK